MGWGYRGKGAAYTEPTVLSCLALLAMDEGLSRPETSRLVETSAQWLAELQQPDGAVGVSEDLPSPRWPTAFAALLWSQLSDYWRPLARSLHWLQMREGTTFTKSDDGVLGHDTMIRGWPWVSGTHSWLEPTGMAILALCRNQLAGHMRITEGVRLILDRAIPGGGWNMGNSVVFSQTLRPQAGPTGIALLALRAAACEETPEVTTACEYLWTTLPTTRSAETLSWGLLGLKSWRPAPAEADRWLAESYENSISLASSPSRLAMLLLAACPHTLSLLGVAPAGTNSRSYELQQI